MPEEQKEKLIQRYLDGKLSLEEKHDFKQQLKADPELKELLDSYSMLLSDMKDLDHPQMPVDLWKRKIKPALIEELQSQGKAPANVVSIFNWKKLRSVMAVAALLIITFGVTIILQSQMTGEKLSPAQIALANIEKNRLEYVAQLDILEQEMESKKLNFDPMIWQIYDESMTKINEAIADAERVYSVYSDDQDAIRVLFTAYDNKAEVIQKFMDMEM